MSGAIIFIILIGGIILAAYLTYRINIAVRRVIVIAKRQTLIKPNGNILT